MHVCLDDLCDYQKVDTQLTSVHDRRFAMPDTTIASKVIMPNINWLQLLLVAHNTIIPHKVQSAGMRQDYAGPATHNTLLTAPVAPQVSNAPVT
jgi:hypothetical protein